MKRRHDSTQITQDDPINNPELIENNYHEAQTLLFKVKENFQKELKKKTKNSAHLAKEKAAIHIENEIRSLVTGVIDYYSTSEQFEDQLRAVKIAIEFFHEYPVNVEIFNEALNQLNKHLELCEHIFNSSAEQEEEAQACIDTIQNNLIPQLYYNFILFFNSELKILGQANNAGKTDIAALTNKQQQYMQILNEYLSSYGQQDLFLQKDILFQVAESYELIADLQYDAYKLHREQYSVRFLRNIIKNYSESLGFKFDNAVWLSIVISRELLIERYKSQEKNSNQERILKEINLIINQIGNAPANLEDGNKIEMIAVMLYACANGYRFSNGEEVYIEIAFELVEENQELLLENQDNRAYENLFKQIFKHLKLIGINENPEELVLKQNANDCILSAKKLRDVQQSCLKESADFDMGDLVSFPVEMKPVQTLEPEVENTIQNTKTDKGIVLNCKREDLRKKPLSTAKDRPFFKTNHNSNTIETLEKTKKQSNEQYECYVVIEPWCGFKGGKG